MKWTQQNRKAYLVIKLIQLTLSLLLFGTTFLLYRSWKHKVPDNELMLSIKFIICMLSADIATFLIDMVMVLKRWRLFITLRFIGCALSFTLGVMVQVDFFKVVYD
mmetsp:Transcript_13193/g.22371  ORF Transcript_13193/g.22371 Transcript_13193/m.22371 type:complete len:106 (+) Transcript_13193:232-549(+)